MDILAAVASAVIAVIATVAAIRQAVRERREAGLAERAAEGRRREATDRLDELLKRWAEAGLTGRGGDEEDGWSYDSEQPFRFSGEEELTEKPEVLEAPDLSEIVGAEVRAALAEFEERNTKATRRSSWFFFLLGFVASAALSVAFALFGLGN